MGVAYINKFHYYIKENERVHTFHMHERRGFLKNNLCIIYTKGIIIN